MSTQLFDKILRKWHRYYQYRLPNDQEERIEAFMVLLIHLTKNGYDDTHINSKKRAIIDAVTNPNCKDSKVLENWKKSWTKDLEDAIEIQWPTIEDISDEVITPEIKEKIRNTKTTRQKTKPIDQEKSADKDIEEANTSWEEMNRPTVTDEMRNAVEGPEVIWDENWEKNLGLKDE